MSTGRITVLSQGKQWGPYSMEQVKFLLGKGAFELTDWALAENAADWVVLGDLLGSLRPPEPQSALVVARPIVKAAEVKAPVDVTPAESTRKSWLGGWGRRLACAGAAVVAVIVVAGWGSGEVDYSQLERREGMAFAPGSDEPFEGQAISYHANGQRMYSAKFVSGKEEGKIASWYANGQKQSEAEMRNGQFHGKVTYWHANGRMMGHYTYENGHVTARKDWDPGGNVYKRK